MKRKRSKIFFRRNFSEGQALVMTVLLLATILAIALTISSIFVTEIRLARDVGESVRAIMAADAGIEWLLYKERKVGTETPPSFNERSCIYRDAGCQDSDGCVCSLSNGASFAAFKTVVGNQVILKSIGTFRTTKRGLQISY